MDNTPKAPARKEDISVFGQESASVHTSPENPPLVKKVRDHAFFGMNKDKTLSPQDELSKLRDLRTDDL
ncbi:MAG: hypothetical protein OXS28_07500 [Gammaproteobacteria bacterium]|nr:hypothetical protein [Gammaproteobacteria bacterium]